MTLLTLRPDHKCAYDFKGGIFIFAKYNLQITQFTW